ncbi:MAG: alpha/beta hydrolase [Acidimicrobiales bacterium]
MDVSELFDPEIAARLAAVPFPPIGEDNYLTFRGGSARPALSDAVERSDHVVAADPPVSVRVHRPRGADGPAPCVYSIHSGGYVIGSYDIDDVLFDRWCPMFGIVGVSVEYRLAPETPYPGALDDCYAGLLWTFRNADELGIDADAIGVLGVSGGGGLAAALALVARDLGETPLAFQLLDCPMLDDRQQTPSSRVEGMPIWSRESNSFGWRSYLGELYGTDRVPFTAAPARATDLAGLPPALVSVGALDGFRDEDIAYAQRLMQAGVPTELHVYPGLPHGVQLFTDAAVVKRAVRDREDWLGRQITRRQS